MYFTRLAAALAGLVATATAGYFDRNDYADNAMWDRYVQKGEHFKCLMVATDVGAGFLIQDTRKPPSAASRWTGDLQQELKTWFWHEGPTKRGTNCDCDKMRLTNVFQGLGLNGKPMWSDEGQPAGGDNVCANIEHINSYDFIDPTADKKIKKAPKLQKYKVGEKEFSATGAFFEFAWNFNGGAIIGKNLEGPAVAAKWNWANDGPWTKEDLPVLSHCSEIYWAYWARGNPNIRGLRIYGAHNVVNDATSKLVARAFRNKDVEKLTSWPGVEFAAGTPEGTALIGSPISASIVHMLVGHKAELGIKHITKVTVVTQDPLPSRIEPKFKEMHLFFHIEDVPADKIPEDKPGEEKSGDKDVMMGLTSRVRRIVRSLDRRSEGDNVVRVHKFRF
ncbi:hypothetical protein BKA63DRAFT_563290 [Paraphoma chrysanthemicola]|nr:hypothetical protein BKA63DRAFT_563290 [Paraphoma chrysanthemicola]